MGVRIYSASSVVVANVLPASAVETVICILPALTLPEDFAQVFLHWMANILAGTSTTALVFRIRRGTTTGGAQVGAAVWTHTLAAGNTAQVGGSYPDTPGAVANQQYCLTCSQTAATVAGTINDLALMAAIL